MLRVEYNINPDHFFFKGGINPTENWTVETRQLHNQVTSATDMMLEETEELHCEAAEDELLLPNVNEEEHLDLNSVDERERDRQTIRPTPHQLEPARLAWARSQVTPKCDRHSKKSWMKPTL